jgi:hypothetical protein
MKINWNKMLKDENTKQIQLINDQKQNKQLSKEWWFNITDKKSKAGRIENSFNFINYFK